MNELIHGAARVMFREHTGPAGLRGPRVCYGADDAGGSGGGGVGDALLDFGGASDAGEGGTQGSGQGSTQGAQGAASQASAQGQQQGQQQQQGQDHGRFVLFNGERIEVPPELWDQATNQPNVAAAVKRALDLRTKLGSLPKAPDNYTLTLPDALKGKIEFDPASDGRWNAAQAWGKKYNVSQAAMEELAALHWTAEASMVDSDASLRQQEMTQLMADLGGDSGPPEERRERATNEMRGIARWAVQTFATKQGPDGPELDREKVKPLEALASTAAGVKLLRQFRDSVTDMPIPGVRGGDDATALSRETLESMMKDPRYNKDAAYTDRVVAGFKRLYGE